MIRSWISKSLSKRVVTFVVSVIAIVALSIPAAASYAPDEERTWEPIDAEAYLYYSQDYGQTLIPVPEEGVFIDYFKEFNCYLVAGLNLERYKTYRISFTLTSQNDVMDAFDEGEFYTFGITESIPKTQGAFAAQLNSVGTNYRNLCLFSRTAPNPPKEVYYTFTFSTSDGYVDNSVLGDVYTTFMVGLEFSYYDYLMVSLGDLKVEVLSDPDGEYFTSYWRSELTRAADDLVEKTAILGNYESQILGQANSYYDSVIDEFTGMLESVNSFASPSVSRMGGENFYSAATIVNDIFDTTMSYMPNVLVALATVIPLLSFIAWLLGW